MDKELQRKTNVSVFEKIMSFLQMDSVAYCVQSDSKPLAVPFELISTDFMRFARSDLGENNEKSLVNALSNVKRALDCRIASLLWLFGYYKISKSKNWSFPQSTDFLLEIGLIAPNVLKKINKNEMNLNMSSRSQQKKMLWIS